ncbi:sensor histidine kinase [candidate division WWE3 bacterium]|jgi:signal transduction histidine kinase|uniref:histidine kinase n=1 Tax=candidate division WWE3 bacterium TaxID=2053526 RepID=A0A3A4ZMD1_UNCKA|nr:MAG: sensor histidine kinase [candidate division WWE3 bacterium]
MFRSAKIKLTALYLSIIMIVTMSFSIVVYRGVVSITERALDSQKIRLERRLRDFNMYNQMTRPGMAQLYDSETLLEIREKTLDILVFINLAILFSAGAAGYYIAGKTLKPIEDMTDQQKRFISDAAHELKTPLAAIKTELEVTARQKKLTHEDAILAMKSTIEEIDRLNEFVAKLLKKSRYQSGNHFEIAEINLINLITKVSNKLNKIAKKYDQKIIISGENIKVNADETALDELFTNLIENAIKFNKKDKTVDIKIKEVGNNAEIVIIDYGKGIPEKDIPHIFEPFYQVERSRNKTVSEGYGLGLSISQEIVKKHKGSITVKSKLDGGTTFKVLLPLPK